MQKLSRKVFTQPVVSVKSLTPFFSQLEGPLVSIS